MPAPDARSGTGVPDGRRHGPVGTGDHGTALRCLALDAVAVRTCAALRSRGITAILLKGSGLGRRLGVADQRLYRDVDLLVAPQTFDPAQDLLDELGYRSLMPDARADDWPHWHARPWRVPGPLRLTVDLHRGFAGVADPERFWTAVSTTSERLELAGGWVPVPDSACAALLVALHAASPGRSGRPRTDLTRALAVFPPAIWRAAADVADRGRATPAFALGLRQVEQGAVLAAALNLPDHVPASRQLAARRAPATAYSLARLVELPTGRARLRHFAVRLFPSPAAMRVAGRLARRGTAGLILAYAVRLARHAWRLPGAVRELRAVVGRAGRTAG